MRCLLRGRLPARGDQATAAASNFVARDCRERPAPVTFTHEIVASGVGSTFFFYVSGVNESSVLLFFVFSVFFYVFSTFSPSTNGVGSTFLSSTKTPGSTLFPSTNNSGSLRDFTFSAQFKKVLAGAFRFLRAKVDRFGGPPLCVNTDRRTL